MRHAILMAFLLIVGNLASAGIGWTLREIIWIMATKDKDEPKKTKHIDMKV